MKKLLFFVLILAFLAGTVSTYAQSYRQDQQDGGYGQNYGRQSGNHWNGRQHPRDGACFYMTAPFRGNSFCMRAGDQMPNLPNGYGDNISSIQIFGNARVRIFNDSDYRNGSAEVWQTISDLRSLPFRDGHTWNNRISSITVSFAVRPDSNHGRPYRQDRQYRGYGQSYSRQPDSFTDNRPHPRDGACFYTTAPFRGQRFCMRAGDRLRTLPDNIGDNISSIAVFGNARVRIFNDSDYRNGSAEVWQTISDLHSLPFRDGHTWNNRISSITVSFGSNPASNYARPYRQDRQDQGYGQSYGQGYGRQPDNYVDNQPHPRDGACFYTTAPFRGQRFCMRSGEHLRTLPDNIGDNISSIAIFGNARVRIFNDSDYRNGSTQVWQTIPDLRTLPFRGGHTWNNRISSIIVY